jgi:hypothetical protein
MSALPPKADMCGALAQVCFGPIADISHTHLLILEREKIIAARRSQSEPQPSRRG